MTCKGKSNQEKKKKEKENQTKAANASIKLLSPSIAWEPSRRQPLDGEARIVGHGLVLK